MDITREDIAAFLDTPIPDASNEKVDAWLSAIDARLNTSFGTVLPATIAPAVYDIVANVIQRRLDRGKIGESNGLIRAQSTGPSSVTYNTDLAGLTGWFWPGEINDLESLFGTGGSVRSVRLSAPDAVRFGNIATRLPSDNLGILGVDESDEYDWEFWDGDAS